MSNYKLTAPEQATLKLLREKGKVFGLEYRRHQCSTYYMSWFSERNELSDEAAYALMVQRGLKELGEMWRVQGCFAEYSTDALLKRLAFFCVPRRDLLAAILAALEDKDDGT